MTNFSINLTPGTTVEFDGEAYVYRLELSNGRLEFTNTRTGGPLQIPDLESGGYRLPDEPWFTEALREGRLAIRSAAAHTALRRVARAQQFSPEEIKAMDKKAELRRLVCTTADEHRVPRSLKQMTRLLAKLFANPDIIADFGPTPPNASTALDWVRTRGTPGDRRWADMRYMTGQVGMGKIAYELREPMFNHALNTWTNRGRKIIDGYAAFVVDAAKINETRAPDEQLTVPSKETFRRMVRSLEERKTVSAKYGKRFVKSRWMGGGQPISSSRILEIAMFDHTPVDMVFCVDAERGIMAGHPNMGIMVDHQSRAILHDEVSFNDPTMCDIGRALLGTNTPKDIPPYYAKRYPLMKTIFGKPDEVYFDNALYQVARGVEDAFADAGVDVCYVGVDEPTHKAVVERLLKIIKELLVEKLPGSTYDIPGMREAGYDPSKHAVMTIQEFRSLLKEAIALYHITAHSGLGGRPPLLVWQRGLSKGRNVIATDQMDQLRRAVGNVVYNVTLSTDGVELFTGLKYTDREIVPALLDDLACMEARRGRPKKPKASVKVKYDDQDISKIEVLNERTKTYVSLYCTNPEYAEGMPLWLHERIREHAKAEALGFNTMAEQLEARHRFNSLILELCPEMAEREARMLAKLADDPALRAKGNVDVLIQQVLPSPSGLESEIPNDMPAKTRVDANFSPPRPARGAAKPKRDPRNAGQPRNAAAKSKAPAKDRRDAGSTTADTKVQPRATKRALGWQ